MPPTSPRSPFPRRVALLLALVVVSTGCDVLADLPKLTRKDLNRTLAQSSKIYANDGTLITVRHGTENRTVIPLKRIPKHVRDAVVAIEDERFYDHDGVDLKAIIRALVTNLEEGEIREGGSTITQQYVKNVIIAPGGQAEKTLRRKLEEAALSRQLEVKLGKREILERYLNTVYFGRGAYGIQAAAKTFFGKGAQGLTIREGATLAGFIRAPSQYDPFESPGAARKRRNTVLAKMAELEFITQRQANKFTEKGLKLTPPEKRKGYDAPYFVDYVHRLIKWDDRFKELGDTPEEREDALFTGGYRIYTTVDLHYQAIAENAVDSILTEPEDPHAALVSIDPRNGFVKAMVGGRDYFANPKKDRFAKFNLAIVAEPNLGCVRVPKKKECEQRAPGTGRQAGSAFKPFALAAALELGIPLSEAYTARDCMDFTPEEAGSFWHVCNYEESAYGTIPLLEATVKSVNTVYAQLILDVGVDNVVHTARDMGIRTELEAVPSSVLGTNAVNALGMTSAFGTLATTGIHHEPVAIEKIVGPDGLPVYEAELKGQPVLDPGVAYLTTTALEEVISRGTGTAANIGRPAAGKTGTAQEYRDAWFVGYTPQLVTGVWVGYPEASIEMKTSCYVGDTLCRPTRIQVYGGSWPAQIWQKFMSQALANEPVLAFEPPDDASLVTIYIDSRTSCEATDFTPEEYIQEIQVPASSVGLIEEDAECSIDIEEFTVPDVTGYEESLALTVLENFGFAGLTYDVPVEDKTLIGRVVEQEPAGGTPVTERGVTVSLGIGVRVKAEPTAPPTSDEMVEVPNVVGMTRPEAEGTLESSGFDVSVVVEAEPAPGQAEKNSGRVWDQSPAGGSEAPGGSTVTIYVNP